MQAVSNPYSKSTFTNALTYGKTEINGRRKYVYGFNGQEKTDEISGNGNHYTAEFWEYDPRAVHRWNIDPAWQDYPNLTPYHINFQNPIWYKDPYGDDPNEYTVDVKTGDRKEISDKGGEELDIIHYGEYKDDGTAFVASKTVTAEKAAPKENLGFTGEKIKSKVNSDFEKYSFERYWQGKGDYHLQVNEFENIVSSAKVEKELNPITLGNGLTVTPKLVSLYGSGQYDAALGRATILYNKEGTAIGMVDIYDFDSKPIGVRSFKNELKTRAVKQASPETAKPFNIWFGIVPPQLISK